MINLLKTSLFITLFCLLAGCASKKANAEMECFRSAMITKFRDLRVSDTDADIVLLNEIQARDVNLAVELIEFSIDNNIIFLHDVINKTTGSEQQKYRDALVRIKEYRSVYPRKTQIFPALDEHNKDIAAARNKAQELLSSYD